MSRSGLASGVYSGTVVFASNGGNVSVTVRMTVGSTTTERG